MSSPRGYIATDLLESIPTDLVLTRIRSGLAAAPELMDIQDYAEFVWTRSPQENWAAERDVDPVRRTGVYWTEYVVPLHSLTAWGMQPAGDGGLRVGVLLSPQRPGMQIFDGFAAGASASGWTELLYVYVVLDGPNGLRRIPADLGYPLDKNGRILDVLVNQEDDQRLADPCLLFAIPALLFLADPPPPPPPTTIVDSSGKTFVICYKP